MINELDKQTLTRLYVKEKLSLRAIAKMYGRSYFYVRYRCINTGIKLRPKTWNRRKIHIDEAVLKKLYIEEGKSITEIAEILSCSYFTIFKRCKEYKIPPRGPKITGITESLLEKLYVEEGKTTREIAKQLGCSFETIRKRCHEFHIPLRSHGTNTMEIDEETLRRF